MNAGKSVEQPSRESEITRGVVNWAVKGLVAKLFVAAVLFAPDYVVRVRYRLLPGVW
jgi:hypothetical protein